MAAGLGLLRTIHAKVDLKVDLMPVDIAINLMCAIPLKVATITTTKSELSSIPVFNCTSGSSVPLKWKQLEHHYDNLYKNPFENMIWYPRRNAMKNNYYLDRISRVLFHWIPAYCVDNFVSMARLKPLNLVKIMTKMTKAVEALEYFLTKEWTWNVKNTLELYDEMSFCDQNRYNFSFKNFDNWDTYFENYALGAREFVMKSDPSTLPACRKKLKKFYIANQLLNIIFVVITYFVTSLLWNLVSK